MNFCAGSDPISSVKNENQLLLGVFGAYSSSIIYGVWSRIDPRTQAKGPRVETFVSSLFLVAKLMVSFKKLSIVNM